MFLVGTAHLFFTIHLGGTLLDNNIKEITKKVVPSVVKVESINGMRKVATGVVIGKDGFIVTTALVSPVGTEISVETSEGKKYEAEFIGMDPVTHIALVKAGANEWKSIEWGEKKNIEVGSWISVVSVSPENSPAVTEGIVSSIAEDKIRLNVCVMPGSSGSPVINEKGQMVGLIRGVYSGQTEFGVYDDDDIDRRLSRGTFSLSIIGTPISGLAVAIPIDVVKKVATEIKEKGKVQRGWLGVSIIENQVEEIEVLDVDKDSPAEKAGLKKGDVVLQFDKEKVISPDMLAHKIRMHKPGDKVEIMIKRGTGTENIKVELGEYSDKYIMEEFKEKFPILFSPDKFKLEKIITPREKAFSFMRREKNYIGVYLEEINRDLSKYFGVSEGTGLLIAKIVKDGPAEKSGLKVGDVIIRVDGKRIEKMIEIEEIIRQKKDDRKIRIEVIRDRKVKEFEVQVEKKEASFPFLSYFNEENEHLGEYLEKEVRFQNKFISYRCIKV